jgi:hypothetical protein
MVLTGDLLDQPGRQGHADKDHGRERKSLLTLAPPERFFRSHDKR